jgi:hypothetical protein
LAIYSDGDPVAIRIGGSACTDTISLAPTLTPEWLSMSFAVRYPG